MVRIHPPHPRKKIMLMFIKIKDFIRYGYHSCKRYDLPYGIENLYRWFKVIWNDRNWDSHYIFVMLRHKLDLTEKHLREYNNHVNATKDANNIRKCVFLLDRIIADVYDVNANQRHEEKWGEAKFEWIDVGEFRKLEIKYPNVKTEEDEKQERKDFIRASEHGRDVQKQDLDMLFSELRKHIQEWWD